MSGTIPQTIRIPTGDEHPVWADLYLPDEPRGLCILCHGFKGYRTWGFLPWLAGCLFSSGFAALSIDFSHNGTIPPAANGTAAQPARGVRYHDPDLFSRNTLSRERSDLASVIRYVIAGGLGGAVDPRMPLGLLGHSRAGVTVILNALEFEEVRAVVSWGTPAHPDIFSDEQKQKWRAAGRIEFTDSASGAPLAIDGVYLKDIEENYELYDLERAVARLQAPYLIVQGIADLPVPPEAAVRLYRAGNPRNPRRLVLVRSGHTFGTAGPFAGPPEALRKAKDETVGWFTIHLGSGV
jgi:pimeloyl-ACP methyl ester carboxylesterase